MQSFTQKMAVAAILLSVLHVSAHADTAASSTPQLSVSQTTLQFVKAYVSYAKAVRDHGAEGVKAFVTSDFVLSGHSLRGSGPPLTGRAAIEALDSCWSGLPTTCFTAAVHPLSVTENDAAALSQEVYTFPIKAPGYAASGTATFCWKQNWRKTAQGWKLAGMRPYYGDIVHVDAPHVEGVTFTVLPETKAH